MVIAYKTIGFLQYWRKMWRGADQALLERILLKLREGAGGQ